ncbi:MAG TPA: DNA starvation/stationary phase protection protein [Alphaproteobacteria bacterium]|nr:DNA starvation/stationary phase protection protein [Alphaproteobacteria bacterium]
MSLNTVAREDELHADIGVRDRGRAEVSKKLSALLASTYLLYLKTLYYHWNVTGPQFVGLHALFEKQYEDLHVAGDELAERIRALGHFTPGTVQEFLSLSSIKDDSELPQPAEAMVRNLLRANEECSKEARHVLELAEKREDQVTADMMIQRMTSHDKAAWMLRAVLE